MLCEFELSRLQMYKKYGTSDGDDKILRDMQKFETNEFDLCGLHCISFSNVFFISIEGCTEGGNDYKHGDVWTCSDGCNTW